MKTLTEAIAEEIINEEHNIRSPYDRSRGQIQQIIDMCDELSKKVGTEISFDNTWGNRYRLTINGKDYDFQLYKDVINALEIVNLFI